MHLVVSTSVRTRAVTDRRVELPSTHLLMPLLVHFRQAYRFLKDTRVAVRSMQNDHHPVTYTQLQSRHLNSEHCSEGGATPLNNRDIRPFPDEILGNLPLRAIIVGHNPSEAAWRAGHYYANPTNWMWRILRDVGIAPKDHIRGAVDDDKMPLVAGIGFTDVGSGHPGTHSSKFTSSHFSEWRQPFFDRLRDHTARASSSIGCSCGVCGAPAVIAFAGKRQFAELFSSPDDDPMHTHTSQSNNGTLKRKRRAKQKAHKDRITFGKQSTLPPGWPLPTNWKGTEVWVLPSTSGAAPMSREERYGPWEALAQRLSALPWPQQYETNCQETV